MDIRIDGVALPELLVHFMQHLCLPLTFGTGAALGRMQAVNPTPVDFAVEFGDQKVPLPGDKVTAVPKVNKLDEFNSSQTNFYYKQRDQWVVAAERQMQYVATVRRVFVIYQTPGALVPEVRTLVDQRPAVLEKRR